MREFNIEKMRIACRAATQTLQAVGEIIKPGITTDDINKWVHEDTLKRGGYPAPLNYRGFPKSCCVSVNDVVCHGIPGKLRLMEGDIVNVDVTTIVDGHFGDTNATFAVGNVSTETLRLMEVTKEATLSAIAAIVPGEMLGIVGKTVQKIATKNGYSVVREFGGHGIGTRFHTQPHVNHYDSGDCTVLKPGMIFTVEPMINMGKASVFIEDDGWTVMTEDGKPSAQYEHTVLVTETGVEILTA